MTPPPPGRKPTLIGDTTGGVGFLDAPGLDAGALFEAVADVIGGMPAGTILTVYTDEPAARVAAPEWCAGHDVDLLAMIAHDEVGTTLTLRHADPTEDAADRRSEF